MNFTKGKIREFYLLTTDVENIFINEYMPAAPGDYVKVYLYGLMYAQQQEEMSHESLARQLRLTEEEVDRAWTYWSEMKAVKKLYNGEGGLLGYVIEFVNLRELMYGKTHSGEESGSAIGTAIEEAGATRSQQLKEMISHIERISGKVLSPRETQEIFSWIKDFQATAEVITYAYEYCQSKGKTNIKYISKVVMQWAEQGFKTADEVKAFLGELDHKYGMQKRILQALGMNRSATEAEKELIDYWFGEMNFNMERVLEACSKTVSIPNPNLRYVNKVLENWYQEAKADGRDVNKKVSVNQATLNQYLDYLRKKAETEAQERKAHIYETMPRIREIDNNITELSRRISRNLLSGRDREALKEDRKLMEMLEEERAILLTENNFTVDYTDIKYACENCKDTGMTEDGRRCGCMKYRIDEAEIWQKTN